MTGSMHIPQPGAAPENAPMTATTRSLPALRPPWWLYAGVIIGAPGVVSLAYGAVVSPASILSAGEQVTGATRVYARYAAAYDIALAAGLVVALISRSWRVLTGFLLQAVFAEFLLAIVGIVDHRWEQVPADILLIAIFALCARRLHSTTG